MTLGIPATLSVRKTGTRGRDLRVIRQKCQLETCGREFSALRQSAKYCDNTCRQKAYDRRRAYWPKLVKKYPGVAEALKHQGSCGMCRASVNLWKRRPPQISELRAMVDHNEAYHP